MSRFGGPTLSAGATADVTLLLEGTYPFVSGGVSSWVHQIISGLPELTFGLVFIGGSPERYDRMRYTLPPNVVHLEEHFLSEVPASQRVVARAGDRVFQENSARLHDALRGQSKEPLEVALERLVRKLVVDPVRHEHDFLFSERAWLEITRRYEATAADRSFLEYFWTIRSMHAPLFIAARVASSIPPSRLFQVISTGFAGFLGMLLRRTRRRPLVLTEHGIYTKERRIELLQANWIKDDDHIAPDMEDVSVGLFRQLWIRFFEALGKMTYDAADPVISLYEGNRARQIKDGADESRTRVIPNGISVSRFEGLRRGPQEPIPPILGLIGRVVPIKDIKTFIRAMRIVCDELAGAAGWIIGPEGEDPAYAEECHYLVASLGLEEKVKFLGFRKIDEIFPRIGINVLTSISEAQPLVVLEGFAAGIPCVATDVGCCRELIEGAAGSDRDLGSAGDVVDIAAPEETARATLALLRDRQRWLAAQRVGIARVERLYTDRLMLDRYRAIYRTALGG